MKIALLDTYHPGFLNQFYSANGGLAAESSSRQKQAVIGGFFGTADFYSRHLNDLGCSAVDLIGNCVPLQSAWAREHGLRVNSFALRIPYRLFQLPVIGQALAAMRGIVDIAIEQIESLASDVVYCQDIRFLPPEALARLRKRSRLIVGQIACPLPPPAYIRGYDLILTSFPHFVDRIRAQGVASEYFRIGFDASVLEALGTVEKNIVASFVGGISRHHGKAVPMLEYMASNTPMEFFGYGAESLPRDSAIRARHRGEVWGLDMYRALARSRITLNRHINAAKGYANNMRLYEATGVGALLLTDLKDNLAELFEIGKEVVAYSSAEEAAELIRYYLAHPDEAQAIARAGQARTLREHTYRHRMEELVPILQRYLQGRVA